MGPLVYGQTMARPKRTTRKRPLALAYVRVSTADQVDSGASLAAQRETLTAEAERRGWDVELVADEGLSAKNLNRPALQSALDRLDRGEADTLMAVRLDRVSRSVADFAGLLDRAGRKGWGLVLLSPALDLADPAGRFTANVLASAAQYERELIGARTREGMTQRRLEGYRPTPSNPTGRPAGRPRELMAEVRNRIVRERHDQGLSLGAIANQLNVEGIPTAQGGAKWYPATVRKIAMAGHAQATDTAVSDTGVTVSA
jgi:DNA invertase Pin-like site-specific DNA recombinase